MSATFKLGKKKTNHSEFRRLMHEQGLNNKSISSPQLVTSPLAKHNNLGQLTCVLCNSIVRAESVWKVHINTKQHKTNIELAKQLKGKLQKEVNTGSKRQNQFFEHDISVKKRKTAQSAVETYISANEMKVLSEEKLLLLQGEKVVLKSGMERIKKKIELLNENQEYANNRKMDLDENKDEQLPEGFFDDPIRDAKNRNVDYRDPQEEEWEKFQYAMKEETILSREIIAEEQEEASTERQIIEIDEQICKWSKVLNLERKKDVVVMKIKDRVLFKDEKDEEDDVEEDENINFHEFLDWRAKRIT